MKGTEVGLLIDQYNFDQFFSQMEVQVETPEAETTNLASVGQEFTPLLPALRITFNGYHHGKADDTLEKELQDRFGAGSAIVTALLQKSITACAVYVLPNAADYELAYGAPFANVVTLNGKWSGKGGRRGYRVWTGAITATGAKASVDFASGVTTGGKAFLHVTAIAGAAVNAAIKVQSAPDDSTWSDEGTFTISAVGAYSLDLSGTVGRYIRINVTGLGGATSITCQAIVSLG